jgi:hypothetical protein
MLRGLSCNLIMDSEVSTRERTAIRQHNQMAACDLGKMTAVKGEKENESDRGQRDTRAPSNLAENVRLRVYRYVDCYILRLAWYQFTS